MSASERLEERLSAVEAALAEMKGRLDKSCKPWWKEWMGAFQDDPLFEQAIKHGNEWRNQQKAKVRTKA